MAFYMDYQCHYIVENFATNIAGLAFKDLFGWNPKSVELLILVHRRLHNWLWNILVEKSASGKHCLS
jgi:hypothetical protein